MAFSHGPGAVFRGKILSPTDWGKRASFETLTARFDDSSLKDADPAAMPHVWRTVANDQIGLHGQPFTLVKGKPAWAVMYDWSNGKGDNSSSFLFSDVGDLMLYDLQWIPLLKNQGPILEVYPEESEATFDLTLDREVIEVNEPHLYIIGRENHGHWIFDHLPLLFATRKFFPDIAALPLVFDKMLPDHPAYLDLFGFKNRHLLLHRPKRTNVIWKFKELYTVGILSSLDCAHLAQEEAAKVARPMGGDAPKRLFLSRDRFSPRNRIADEPKMQAFLEARGFHILRPELLNPQETVDLMQQAEILVLPYGAGLGNLPLANAKTQIILLAPSFLVENRFENEVLRYFRRFVLPFHDRIRFVGGERPGEKPFGEVAELNFSVVTFDLPLEYDLKKLDFCLMQAEAARIRAR